MCLQMEDLCQCRIEAYLATMSSTLLLRLPTTDTWSVEKFLSEVKVGGRSWSGREELHLTSVVGGVVERRGWSGACRCGCVHRHWGKREGLR